MKLDLLDREGYLLLPDVLDAAQLQRLRVAFEDAPLQATGTRHVALGPETPEIDAWEALRAHPVVLGLAAHVLGSPAVVRDLHGRDPLPGFGQQGLHADWMPRAPGAGCFVVTAIWMLDDFTLDNGATRVVPGSHRIFRPISKALAQPLARHPEEHVVTGTAGTALVFNGHLWHSGRRNDSTRSRRAAQMVMVRATP